MVDSIQLLTVTGERPEAFALCQKWMQRQTFAGGVDWFIVDDGRVESPIEIKPPKHWNVIRIRPPVLWTPGANTQCSNLAAGLESVGDGPLAIIEDDDWYEPGWLEFCATALDSADLVGECRAVYYNVASRVFRRIPNVNHASLCATAVKGPALDRLREVVDEGHKFVDLRLWSGIKRGRMLHDPAANGRRHVVGMKGMPGRDNIGIGRGLKGDPDPSGRVLRDLIGDDAEEYARFHAEGSP